MNDPHLSQSVLERTVHVPYNFENFSLSEVDLSKVALNHLDFLERVDTNASYYYNLSSAFMKRARWRYEVLWLPLAWKHRLLVAPLDIHWLWHVHMLSPTNYRSDCWRVLLLLQTGKLDWPSCEQRSMMIDHAVLPERERQMEWQRSHAWWTETHPNEPFEQELRLSAQPPPEYESHIEYDILDAVTRQKSFYYQVSLPHYRDPQFLQSALERYGKFLYLKQQYPDMFLVPCYDVDLMWHTHQLHPSLYFSSTNRLLPGRILPHDDSVNERIAVDSKLIRSEILTRQLWTMHFPGEPYFRPGCLYRGESSRGQMPTMTPAQLDELVEKSVTITVDCVSISLSSEDKYELILLALSSPTNSEVVNPKSVLYQQKVTRNILRKMSNSSDAAEIWTEGQKLTDELSRADLKQFTKRISKIREKFGIVVHEKVKVKVQPNARIVVRISKRKESLWFEERTWSLHESAEPLWPHLKQGTNELKTIEIHKKLGPVENEKLNFRIHISPAEPQRFIFHLPQQSKKSQFHFVKVPANEKIIREFWGPIHAFHNIKQTEHFAWVSVTKLLNHKDEEAWEVRVIHSVKFSLSVVQVFHKQCLVAISHTIDLDQLPAQGMGSFITLANGSGRRAMLIKDNLGDHVIVTGQWQGLRLNGPSQLEHPGRLSWTRYSVDQRRDCHTGQIPNAGSVMVFPNMSVDFKAGRICVEHQKECVAQLVCQAFSVAVLMVLCQPRFISSTFKLPQIVAFSSTQNSLPIGVEGACVNIVGTPQQQLPKPVFAGFSYFHSYDLRDFPIVVACGYTFDPLTPCNALLQWVMPQLTKRNSSSSRSDELQDYLSDHRPDAAILHCLPSTSLFGDNSGANIGGGGDGGHGAGCGGC